MSATGYDFIEFPWQSGEPDPKRDRLCRRPARDPVRIDCAIEGASFASNAEPKDEIVVLAYNLERGLKVDEQLQALQSDPEIPPPDIVLVSEADRGCTRTDSRNVTREWAEALSMNYVYGAEFIELPRFWGPGGGAIWTRCEHGNAILSRYPLGNVRLIRHAKNFSWYSWWQRLLHVGEPRLGGRVAVAADVKVGDRYLHLYSLHLESRGSDEYRPAQAAEVAEDALRQPFDSIIGGDLNSAAYLDDLRNETTKDVVTQALLQRGFTDAHAGLEAEDRITTQSGVVIDLIFGRDVSFLDAGIGDRNKWGELSDHLPVWARVRLD
jgi:endonuclease/exonuclease/phosphatase family metal-dependent hydrolase